MFPVHIVCFQEYSDFENIIINNMDSDTAIEDIKFLIWHFVKIPICQQKIYYKHTILSDGKILDDYNIISKTTIMLEILDIIEEID